MRNFLSMSANLPGVRVSGVFHHELQQRSWRGCHCWICWSAPQSSVVKLTRNSKKRYILMTFSQKRLHEKKNLQKKVVSHETGRFYGISKVQR
jgi:hypothetical protein